MGGHKPDDLIVLVVERHDRTLVVCCRSSCGVAATGGFGLPCSRPDVALPSSGAVISWPDRLHLDGWTSWRRHYEEVATRIVRVRTWEKIDCDLGRYVGKP